MKSSRVVNNAVWIIVCKAIQAVLNFVVTLLSARYLGPSNYGLISYAASVTAFFVPFAQLGLNNIIVQEVINAPDEEGEILGTSILYSIGSSFVSIICAGVITYFLNIGETDTLLVTLLYSISLIFQCTEMIQYWYQAKLLSKYTSIISLISYIMVSAYKISLLALRKSVYWFAVSYSIDFAIISIGLIIIYFKLNGSKFKSSKERFFRLFNKSKYYIIPGLMVTIFTHTDRIMLKQMIDNAAAGYYSAAVSCAGITGFVINAIIDSFRPPIFEANKTNQDRFEKNVITLYSTVIYFCLIQSILTVAFSGFIVRIIYGEAYLTAVPALRIVTWYVTFACLGTVRNIWMLAKNRQDVLWIINVSGALANVILNFLLIPIMGINGAALASLVSQGFANVVLGFILPTIRDNNKLMVESIKPQYMTDMVRDYLIPIISKRR